MTTLGVDSRARLTAGETHRRLTFTALLVVVLVEAAVLSLLIGDLKNAIRVLGEPRS